MIYLSNMDTMLPQMVDELNRIQDDKPMYMHYNLDTKERLEHFFAQCCVEVGDDFKTEENLNYSAIGLMQTFSYYRKSKDNQDDEYGIKQALLDGRVLEKEKDYSIAELFKKLKEEKKNDRAEVIASSINALMKDCIDKWTENINNNQEANIKAIKEKLNETKDNYDGKAYTPAQLIQKFKKYRTNLDSIELAFKHGTIKADSDTLLTIDGINLATNEAPAIIAQALFDDICLLYTSPSPRD